MSGPIRTRVLSLAALLACAVVPAQGQSSVLALDLRVGITEPVRSFASSPGSDVSGDLSFGAHLGYRLSPALTFRIGFSQHRFDCPGADGEGACGPDGGYVYTGWDVGGRVLVASGPLQPWLGASVVFARVETGGLAEGDAPEVSDLSAGFEAGAGLSLPLNERVHFTPAVRYGWLDTRFPGRTVLRMRWIVADLGVSVGF